MQAMRIIRSILFMLVPVVALVFLAQAQAYADEPCREFKAFSYKGTKVRREATGRYYGYVVKSAAVKIDADGAPNAYHPDDRDKGCGTGGAPRGLDCPKNAGYPNKSWWRNVLLPDPQDRNTAYVQRGGPYDGYYLSQTTLQDPTKPVTSTERYVDAATVPYIVFPGPFYQRKGTGRMGDIGYAVGLDSGLTSAFVVAEVGPSKDGLGEMSIALAMALGAKNPSPRTGLGNSLGRVLFIVFPGSAQKPGWPLGASRLQELAANLLQENGGLEAVEACLTAAGR